MELPLLSFGDLLGLSRCKLNRVELFGRRCRDFDRPGWDRKRERRRGGQRNSDRTLKLHVAQMVILH